MQVPQRGEEWRAARGEHVGRAPVQGLFEVGAAQKEEDDSKKDKSKDLEEGEMIIE